MSKITRATLTSMRRTAKWCDEAARGVYPHADKDRLLRMAHAEIARLCDEVEKWKNWAETRP